MGVRTVVAIRFENWEIVNISKKKTKFMESLFVSPCGFVGKNYFMANFGGMEATVKV